MPIRFTDSFRDTPKNHRQETPKSLQVPVKSSDDDNQTPKYAAISTTAMIPRKRPVPSYIKPTTLHAPPASAPHPHPDPPPSPIVAATSLLFANNNPQTLHSVSGPAGPILQHGLSAAPHSIQPRRWWPASALYSPVSPLPGKQTQKGEGNIPSSSSSPPASRTAPPTPAPPARAAAGCGC